MPVRLNCKARGNPRTQITWRREDGKPIRLCAVESHIGHEKPQPRAHGRDRECREVMVHYGTELALPHVSRHDSGVYFCLATNGVPPTVSKKVRLYVDCKAIKITPTERFGQRQSRCSSANALD